MLKAFRIPDTDAAGPTESQALTALDSPKAEEAWRQGWWAYSFGYGAGRNPYERGRAGHAAWLDGLTQAMEDDEG